jgi:hypothetical protein
VTVINTTTCSSSNLLNLVIAPINANLSIPGFLSSPPRLKLIAKAPGLSAHARLIDSTGQGADEATLEMANETWGFILFALNNAAVQKAMGQLGSDADITFPVGLVYQR